MSDFVIENGVFVKYLGAEQNIVLPDGVQKIGEYAFDDQYEDQNEEFYIDNITSVTIPTSVKAIGKCIFPFHEGEGYVNDIEIIYLGTKEEWNQIYLCDFWNWGFHDIRDYERDEDYLFNSKDYCFGGFRDAEIRMNHNKYLMDLLRQDYEEKYNSTNSKAKPDFDAYVEENEMDKIRELLAEYRNSVEKTVTTIKCKDGIITI